MITVEIDNQSGFCFGVVTAIQKAEQELAKGAPLYCLGDIVHNGKEVERLEKMGLITINHQEFAQLKNVKVLLRAHGEPPETYQTAKNNNIELIDATCPVVIKLQKKIQKSYADGAKQIVIYGKPGHAEVLGLIGQTEGSAIVIDKIQEVEQLDLTKDIKFYSQTTQSLTGFGELEAHLKKHLAPEATLESYDTICRQVANRLPNIRLFAANHDLVFFVSGKKSSNGKVLFEACKEENANTHFISSLEELDVQLLTKASSIGICGATSTPKWLMEAVKKQILDWIAAHPIS